MKKIARILVRDTSRINFIKIEITQIQNLPGKIQNLESIPKISCKDFENFHMIY